MKKSIKRYFVLNWQFSTLGLVDPNEGNIIFWLLHHKDQHLNSSVTNFHQNQSTVSILLNQSPGQITPVKKSSGNDAVSYIDLKRKIMYLQ